MTRRDIECIRDFTHNMFENAKDTLSLNAKGTIEDFYIYEDMDDKREEVERLTKKVDDLVEKVSALSEEVEQYCNDLIVEKVDKRYGKTLCCMDRDA